MDKKIDSNLIQCAQAGDSKALEELLLISRVNIRQYVKRHCLVSDIDDVIQETMLTISLKIVLLKHVYAYTSWAMMIAKRECQRALRKFYSFKELNLFDLKNQLDEEKSDLEIKKDLIEAIMVLPGPYREIILMKDFEGQSLVEIAERLDESVDSVKSRLHRARSKLKEILVKEFMR